MKTLLTTDGSRHAALAMTSAARLLVHRNNQFDTILVVPGPPLPARSRDSTAYEARMKDEAGRRLETAGRVLLREGIRAGRIVETGSPADAIIERAAESGIDSAYVFRS